MGSHPSKKTCETITNMKFGAFHPLTLHSQDQTLCSAFFLPSQPTKKRIKPLEIFDAQHGTAKIEKSVSHTGNGQFRHKPNQPITYQLLNSGAYFSDELGPLFFPNPTTANENYINSHQLSVWLLIKKANTECDLRLHGSIQLIASVDMFKSISQTHLTKKILRLRLDIKI